MLNRFSTCVLALAAVIAGISPAVAQRRGSERDELRRYRWETSLDAAVRTARRTGRPMMVVIRCVP